MEVSFEESDRKAGCADGYSTVFGYSTAFFSSISLRLAAIAAFRSSSSLSSASRAIFGCEAALAGSGCKGADWVSTPTRFASSNDIWRANFRSLSSSSSTLAFLGCMDRLDCMAAVGETLEATGVDLTVLGALRSS
jgi:hypothetical protein